MKLRPEFEAIRAYLLHRQVGTIVEALGELIREETRLRSQTQLEQSGFGDYAFAEVDHIQPHCKRRNECIYCKSSGHIILKCKSLVRKGKSGDYSLSGSSRTVSGSRATSGGRGVGGSSYAMEVTPSGSAAVASGTALTAEVVHCLVAEVLQETLPVALTTAFAMGALQGG
ncbi:unnamed protein product [Linum trigynum]|uniref:Uncharacterized protein n=1 Tax=Linum trigynum TaxID=586398 RepID=A0AAV2CKU9_9ROSI